MVINAFKKEFRQKLGKLMGITKTSAPNTKRSSKQSPRQTDRSKNGELPDPKNYILNFDQVQQITAEMHFIKPEEARPDTENIELQDLYIMFKCNTDQNILAENLQNALMIISGIRDRSKEIHNDVGNQRWMMSGVYEEQTGIFYFREGEHVPVVQHFKQMHINRYQQKKSASDFKKKDDDLQFEPKILERSKEMANKYRQKQLERVGLDGAQVSDRQLKKLVDYESVREKELKIERMRRQKEAKEDQELTL